MNPQRPFVRKIVYLVAMAVLLMILVWLGQPATIGVGNEKGSAGGVLARLRQEYNFSEAQLGEIDPAGETLKLATLGLRGVAVNLLWEKSNTYKMKKDWANLAATLNQIILLEPHFSKVWYFQGWNLSYNVSVEFDDYRERYRWVIKGIDFLKKGIRYNRKDPLLYRDVAWFISQKIGRADESAQFRKLFKADDDFHREDEYLDIPARPPEDRDNWLVGKDWYARAEKLVDVHDPAKTIRRVTPVLFFSYRPMCQMNYSEALAKDGIFDEKARLAWIRAASDWAELGVLPLPGVPLSEGGEAFIKLNDRDAIAANLKDLVAQLDALAPGLREKIREERLRSLSPAERKVHETPDNKRSPQDWELVDAVDKKLRVSDEDVAFRVPGQARAKAQEIARKCVEARRTLGEIESQRTIVNFEYWQQRAKVEQAREVLKARKSIYLAEQAKEAQDLALARKMYVEAFDQWRKVLDMKEWADLKKQESLGHELVELIWDYKKLLESETPPQQLPKNFVLQDILDLYEKTTPRND